MGDPPSQQHQQQQPEGPLPKPSRFQFVPVPGEFTRGRWKCRDSYHPYAETLEFENKAAKPTRKQEPQEDANPDKISVFFKLRPSPLEIAEQEQKEREKAAAAAAAAAAEAEAAAAAAAAAALAMREDTIQVTSVEKTSGDLLLAEPDAVAAAGSESIIITRKNGVTIVRKTSGDVPDEEPYDRIRELSIDDFEQKQLQAAAAMAMKVSQVPPTPMNTPPATMGSGSVEQQQQKAPKVFQVQSVIDSEPATQRKLSHDVVGTEPTFPLDAYSATLPSATKLHKFQVDVVPELITTGDTFQVIQTEESKNMSMDSVKNVIDVHVERVVLMEQHVEELPPQITVSGASEPRKAKTDEEESSSSGLREPAGSVSSLDACGIPILAASSSQQLQQQQQQQPPIAPHSTPYGTPKDTQRSPTIFDDAFASGTVAIADVALLPPPTAPLPTPEASLPIDNKIEQAMELVKTHLTYAVREEVDTLRNTITDLEYQMREFQYECNYYRQHCTPETVEQATQFVRQQMAKYQQPAPRRAVSTSAVPTLDAVVGGAGAGAGTGAIVHNQMMSGAAAATSSSSTSSTTIAGASTHMRNLQTQIQQIKIAPSTSSGSSFGSGSGSGSSSSAPPPLAPATSLPPLAASSSPIRSTAAAAAESSTATPTATHTPPM